MQAIGPRRRIAIQARSPESVCALFFAFARSDTDLFLFNPDWSEEEIQRAIEIAAPHGVLGDEVEAVFAAEKNGEGEGAGAPPCREMRIMIPTGGTTGGIRFAIHNGPTLLASARAFRSFFGVDRISVHCVLPLYHVSGFMQVIRAIVCGGEVLFGSVREFEKSHAGLASKLRETRFVSLVPTQLNRLLAAPGNLESILRSYTAILLGGGPAPPELLDRGRALGLPLAPTYGMTETASMVATLKPESFLAGRAGQGVPLPHAKISILPLEIDGAIRKDTGRIQVEATSLFLGYYGGRARERDSFLTNDWGRYESSSGLAVMGRLDRVIISGGENVALDEVERVLKDTGLVVETVAFGQAHGEWGEQLCVAYQPVDPSLELVQLKEAVERSLAPHKRPKRWLSFEKIPRNELGKVDIGRLRQITAKTE